MSLSLEDIQRLGELPSAQRNKLPLTPGDDVEGSVWKNLYNLRLEVQGNYIFWKTRGGSTVVNSFFGNILTVYPLVANTTSGVKEFLAVHTAAGKVFLWDIDAGTSDEIVASGFSTSQQIQFTNIGRFLYMFDYDGGNAQYYDVVDALLSPYLSYDKAYISSVNYVHENMEGKDNVMGIEVGQRIIAFPNETSDEGAEIITSADGDGFLDPSNYIANSFRYIYNGGEFLIDENGNEYTATQFLTFPDGADPFRYTVGGSGAAFTIEHIYIPLDEFGEPSFDSYVTKVTSVGDSGGAIAGERTTVGYHDLNGVSRAATLGGADADDYDDKALIFPYNADLEGLVGRPSSKTFSNDGTSVVENSQYERPKVYRQYVCFDMLNDGSITIAGKPFQAEIGVPEILGTGVSTLRFTVTTAGDNVEKRFVATTRWQLTPARAFDPVSEEYPNSPLFITGEVNIDRTIFDSRFPDRKLFRAITELQPLVAGVCDLFDSKSLKPNSVAQFTGSLMISGYTVNRPIPRPYTNPAAETDGNIHINITPTTQLANDMALAFMFEYVDGQKSQIVETEEFLQEGSTVSTEPIACDQTKASASHEVLTGAASDGTLTVTYDGVTVNVALTSASHGTAETAAEAIRAAIQADSNIMISASITTGAEIDYEEKRFGEEFNGNVIAVDPAGTGVSFDTEDPALADGAEPDALPAKIYIRMIHNYKNAGEPDTTYFLTVDGYGNSEEFDVEAGQTNSPETVNELATAVNNAAALNSDWEASVELINIGGSEEQVCTIASKFPGDTNYNDVLFNFNVSAGEALDVEWGFSSPGTLEQTDQGRSGGASSGCTQATASVDVSANNLAGSATEDHTLVVDGNSTSPITIADTDTTEQIVDKYIAEIEATPIIDVDWAASKVDQGGGVWRLLLTYRQYGTAGNSKVIDVTGETDIALTVNSPSSGGTDGGTTPVGSAEQVNANRLQIHSLNTLISKVFVLGRTVDGATAYHLIADYNITDAEAQGLVIDLPNTTEALDDIETDTFPAPASNEILETVELVNFMNVGTPFQQFQVSTQEEIVDGSRIRRAIPVDFDTDKSTMRYRVMIFTDRNIQLGYLVDAQSGAGRVFESDFEIVFAGKTATSREGITDVNGNIFWESRDAVYAWAKQGRPERIFDRRRYSVSEANELIDVVYNEDHNEVWFIYRNNDVVVFGFDTGTTRRMQYSGVGLVRCGAFFGNKLYIAADTELYQTDIPGTLADGAGDTVTGVAETGHLADELVQPRLLDVTIGGQNFSAQVEVDLQRPRFEDDATAWSDDFTATKDLGSKTLKMHGVTYQVQEMAVMPRMRITAPAVANGIIAHAILKVVPTQNIGKARQ